jgi:hypothetical protein
MTAPLPTSSCTKAVCVSLELLKNFSDEQEYDGSEAALM